MLYKQLWEILVPVKIDGVKVKKKHHRAWDKKVSSIAGGVTLFGKKKGRWLYKTKLYREKMIRVRIAATEDEIKTIAKITAEHYNQIAIMATLVSARAIIMEFK